MKRTWSVGLLAGLISGVVGIGMYYLLIGVNGFHFKQLNPVSILIASIVSNLVGAFIYVKLREKTTRPRLHYTWISIGFALLLTLMDWVYPPEPHIGDIAAPIHAIVVTISIILIPNRLRRSNR